ncbi:MAG: tetratricopeptide repeat protein [Elusimicrobia bacterium]|nr:tetratricopeptide repeat protein [Elusimicrobiota bacterium]
MMKKVHPGLAIFLFALIIRLVYLYQIKDSLYFQIPILDAAFYNEWAGRILSGGWIGKDNFYLNPGYPYFLGIIYSIFGKHIIIAVLIQFILGSLSCFLIYSIADKLFNRTVGVIAGIISAAYSVSVYYEGFLVTASLISFINLLAVWILMTGLKKSKIFTAGLCLGFSILLRPNILLFVFIVPVWIRIAHKDSIRSLWYFIAGIFTMLFPVMLRNYFIIGQLALAVGSSGMNFYIGNNPYADGAYGKMYFKAVSNPAEQAESFRREAGRILKRNLSYSESSSYWYKRSFDFIKNEPVKWIKLLFRKFVLFWNRFEIKMNYDYYFIRHKFFLLKAAFVNFCIVAPLCIMGLVFAMRPQRAMNPAKAGRRERREGISLLFFYVFSYVLALILFFVTSEYRYPAVWALIIFASYGIYYLYGTVKRKDIPGLVMAVLGLFFAVYLTSVNFYESDFAHDFRNFAGEFYEKGYTEEAVSSYKEAIRIKPEKPDAYYDLGTVYLHQKKYDMAISYLKKALEIKPDYDKVYNNLGLAYKLKKDYPKAIKVFRKCIDISPEQRAAAYNNLGLVYVEMGELSKAFENFLKAVKLDPGSSAIRGNYEKCRKILYEMGK